MPSNARSEALELVRRSIAMPVDELWLACFAIGSHLTVDQLTEVLVGATAPSDVEYNVTAAALNEAAADARSALRVPGSNA